MDRATTPDERRRLAVLASYGIMDTPTEQAFDDLAHLAAEVCDTPVALVSFVGPDRQWFKARVGFPRCETDLDSSVCRFVLSEPDLLIIPDLTRDPRTATNPLVTGDPGIRFYAGAPLRTDDGEVLGSLCAIDTEPRPGGLSARQADALGRLARQVMAQLEIRRMVAERDDALDRQDLAGRVVAERGMLRSALAELGDCLGAAHDVGAMGHVAASIMGRALGASRAGYGSVDPRRDRIEVVADWCAAGVRSVAGEHDLRDYGSFADELRQGRLVVMSDVRTDPAVRARAEALAALGIASQVNVPVLENGALVAVTFAHFDRPRSFSPEELAFVRAVADRTRVGVARLRAEERQAVLNGEISHRLKNTLAMVQAIASQTLKGAADPAVLHAFDQRLLALSRAHDVLFRSEWESADLHTVVDDVLELAGVAERCSVAGPPVLLGSRATLSASLLLHELATNARKHGSLSTEDGSVAVSWGLEGDGDGGDFLLDWFERGGPAASPPTRKGFGSRLLRLGLVGTGGSELHYDPEGFSASFRATRRQVEQA